MMKDFDHRCVELLSVCFMVSVALAIGMLMAFTATIQAAYKPQGTAITVTDTGDDNAPNGNCTLREAVIAANTDSAVDNCPAGDGLDTIILPPGAYALGLEGYDEDASQTGDLDIIASVTIGGAGATTSIVSGSGDRVLDIDPTQTGNVNVNLFGLTVRSGGASMGGCVQNKGALSIKDSVITGCWAYGAAGILNYGTLTITNSAVTNNHIGSNMGGSGGIWNGGRLVIEASVVSDNSAKVAGGIGNSGTLIMTNSTVSHNGAMVTGAISNSGDMTILNSTIMNNHASGPGGIYNSSALTISNSLIYSNTAHGGEGVALPTMVGG